MLIVPDRQIGKNCLDASNYIVQIVQFYICSWTIHLEWWWRSYGVMYWAALAQGWSVAFCTHSCQLLCLNDFVFRAIGVLIVVDWCHRFFIYCFGTPVVLYCFGAPGVLYPFGASGLLYRFEAPEVLYCFGTPGVL